MDKILSVKPNLVIYSLRTILALTALLLPMILITVLEEKLFKVLTAKILTAKFVYLNVQHFRDTYIV